MKKNTFVGFNKDGSRCCLLHTFLTFNVIKNNLADLEESDFVHDATCWDGCDTPERTADIAKLKLTGKRVELPRALVYVGTDVDMGVPLNWMFEVSCIAEAVPADGHDVDDHTKTSIKAMGEALNHLKQLP